MEAAVFLVSLTNRKMILKGKKNDNNEAVKILRGRDLSNENFFFKLYIDAFQHILLGNFQPIPWSFKRNQYTFKYIFLSWQK